jgi:nitrite reductase (NADH) large subunit
MRAARTGSRASHGSGPSGAYAAADVGLVEVQFQPVGRIVLVAPGTTLLAAGRAAGVEIATGCERGMCGTDAVRVAAGGDGMTPAADPERSTLERMGLDPAFRLSCSARVRSGVVRVELGAF